MRLGFTGLCEKGHPRVLGSKSEISINDEKPNSLSPTVAAMRPGVLPGILPLKEAIRFDLLIYWPKLFPRSTYPQIVIALTSLCGELQEKGRTVDVTIEVGKVEGLLDSTFQRL